MKKNYCYCLILILLGTSCQVKVVNSFTTKAERTRFVNEKTLFIDSVFANSPAATNEKKYQGAFWASELMLLKNDKAVVNLKYALGQYSSFSDNFKRVLLQQIYTLYPTEFVSEIERLIKLESNEKHFAMMANYLIRQNDVTSERYKKLMHNQFPDWQDNPLLTAFSIEHSKQMTLTQKQINELIAFRSEAKEPTLFVFVHKNRDIPGEAIIQNKQGKLLIENGDTLRFCLLARSITNMAEYLTNGNTPQGVFSVQGFGSSDNVFIGKSPMIITALPYEITLSGFSFGKIKNEWSLEQYNQFFPESWKSYLPKNMAFYAGKAGRSEIIIHGTTIDTEFYKTQSYYPFTPSLGCLCALERWNEADGSLIESEQLRLVNTLKSNGIEDMLMYVIEK